VCLKDGREITMREEGSGDGRQWIFEEKVSDGKMSVSEEEASQEPLGFVDVGDG
jgi:hypothetical protein